MFSKNDQISNLINIRAVGDELFYADGQTKGQTKGQTEMRKYIFFHPPISAAN
jgi:hypothetical protein